MKKIMVNKVFDTNSYVLLLAIWLMVNSIRFVSTHTVSQVFSIFFALWGILIIISNTLSDRNNPFNVSGTGIAFIFIVGVMLSFVGNGFTGPVKNIYTVISVSINFLVLYTYSFIATKSDFYRLMKTIIIGVTIINVINLLLLLFGVSIELANNDEFKTITYIGIDTRNSRMTGIGGNSNGLSRVAMNGIIAYSYIFLNNRNKRKSLMLNLSLLINTLVLLLSQSRAGIYSISVGLGVLILAYSMNVYKEGIFKKTLVIMCSVLVVLSSSIVLNKVSYFAVENYPTIDMRVDESNSSGGEAGLTGRDDEATNTDISNGRFTLMKTGIEATVDQNILFGLTYSDAKNRISSFVEETNLTLPNHLKRTVGSMHNTFVQAFVYYGLIGFVPLIIFFIYLAIVFTKKIFNNKKIKKKDLGLYLYASFVIGVMLPMNMVEWVFVFDFDNHLINLIMFVSLGLFINVIKESDKDILSFKQDSIIRSYIKKIMAKVGGVL